MLTDDEMLKIRKLSKENPEVDYIIKRLNEESKFMISRISHEIRNPLTLISSTLQLMESKNPELPGIKYWPQIRNDVNELILMLNELADFNNSDVLNVSPVNLSYMIQDIAASFETLSFKSGNKISISIHDTAIPYIQAYSCDRIKLKQVFTNIMKNAFDAMKEGNSLVISVKVSKKTSLTKEDGSALSKNTNPSNIIISFSNNGAPIPSDHLDTLFDPFITHKNGGTGLGLAVAARIIKAHKGTITVESNKSLTSFMIILPIR